MNIQSFCDGACLVSLNPFCSRLLHFAVVWTRFEVVFSRFPIVSRIIWECSYTGYSCPRSFYDFFVVVFTSSFARFATFCGCVYLFEFIPSFCTRVSSFMFVFTGLSRFDLFIVLRSCKLGMHSYSLVYNRGYVLVLQFFVLSYVQFTIVCHRCAL